MSNITVYCFTAFCVRLQSNPPYEIAQKTLELRYLERSLEFINHKLEFFEDKLKLTQERDSNDILHIVTNNAVFRHAGPALRAVSDAVATAEYEGRNSSYCYTIAARIMEDETRRIYDFEVIPCVHKFTDAVEQILKKVKPLRADIERIQYDFDDTVPKCYNSTNIAWCLTTAVWDMKYKHKVLETSVKPLINAQMSTYPRLKYNFEACVKSAPTKLQAVADYVQDEGILCAETTGTFIHSI